MFSTAAELFPRTPFCVLVVFFAAKQKPIKSLQTAEESAAKVQLCTVQRDWPEVKHEHRWWVLQTVLLLTRNPWWTLTDFTYKPVTVSLALNSCLPVFFFFVFSFLFLILVLVPCVHLCRSLLSFVVMVTLIGQNILCSWALHPSRETDVTVWPLPFWW